MAADKNNQGQKVLNVPNKREQSQACLGYAEREGLRPQGNVPNLRFPEFSGEWEKKTIGDFGDIITGNTPSTKEEQFYVDGKHLWVSPSDLGYCKFIHDTQTKLTDLGFAKTRKLPKGSILVTCIGSTIGKMGMASRELSTNQQINSVVVSEKYDNDFIYYAIQSRFPRYLSSIAVQAVPILSKSSFSALPNDCPSFDEQSKIGRLLRLIDERIDTQNKIIDKLKSLIKGLAGALIGGCQGSECCLGDISKIYQPQTISSSKLTPEGFPVYGANGIIGHYTSYNHEYEQVCVTCRGNTCGTVNFTQRQAWITGNAMVINVDDNTSIDKRFLYYTLFITDFSSIISGSGQPQIVRAPLSKIKIVLPSKEEQIIISKTLDAISAKAEMEVNCLNILLCQKLYLLRSMFI